MSSDFTPEQRERIEQIMREAEERKDRETGKAMADLVCETPVVREIAGAIVSVLSLFK